MSSSIDRLPARSKRDLFLIVSSGALALFTIVFLWAAISSYRDRIESISLKESRFVRTEWHLLEDLKAQTDQELLEKDQEIADLNRRYVSLLRHSGSPAEIGQIHALLQQAKAQREVILSRSAVANAVSPTDQKAWLTQLLPSSNPSALSQRILQDRVSTLEAQLAGSRRQDEELAAEVSALKASAAAAQARYESTISDLTAARSSLQDALTTWKQDLATVQPPGVAELETRALVRAIVASPEIRSRYPELLGALDSYLREYAREERAQGRQEAYIQVQALLDGSSQEKGGP